MHILKKSLLFGSLLAFQLSCVTRGEQFSSDYHWIKDDATSQQEVLQRLGNPTHVGHSAGRPAWTYGYYNFRLIGESHTKELTIYWNPENRVDSFNFKSSFPEDRNHVLMKSK